MTKICQSKPVFKLDEANALLPLLDKISAKHDLKINKLLATQRYMIKSGADKTKIHELDQAVIRELQVWKGKVLKLGVKSAPGGYYLFDSGYGWFSWYPTEAKICYYHDYTETPASRRLIGKLELR